MQPRDLIVSARRTVGKGRGKPRQADLNRALSSAYYAMFHTLCRNCADCFIGKTHQFRNQSAWQQAYRAIEHGVLMAIDVTENIVKEVQDSNIKDKRSFAVWITNEEKNETYSVKITCYTHSFLKK